MKETTKGASAAPSGAAEPLVEAPALAAARAALLRHYDREARDLPWRHPDPDPYRVLVSEVMLQQTRVETVIRYYDAWLDRFPTLDVLAGADEDQVLKAWEGLGYYRRARNLHRAVRFVREQSGGALPTTAAGLRALPGVGEYTAGAVASIAFGEPVPAVDGNVRRVLARLHDVSEPTPSWLRTTAGALVDPERPGDFNQALMELGATVCTPRAPSCGRCPVARWCAARAADTVLERPAPRRSRSVPVATFCVAVLHRGGRVLVVRRPEGGLLAGMWAFPERDLDGRSLSEVARSLARSMGVATVGEAKTLPEVRHRFSHLDARYLPVVLRAAEGVEGAGAVSDEERRWIHSGGDEVALPVAQRKVLDAWNASSGAPVE